MPKKRTRADAIRKQADADKTNTFLAEAYKAEESNANAGCYVVQQGVLRRVQRQPQPA